MAQFFVMAPGHFYVVVEAQYIIILRVCVYSIAKN
jgi:hypothetical protein